MPAAPGSPCRMHGTLRIRASSPHGSRLQHGRHTLLPSVSELAASVPVMESHLGAASRAASSLALLLALTGTAAASERASAADLLATAARRVSNSRISSCRNRPLRKTRDGCTA